MVQGLIEQVRITAMYATAANADLWEDRPAPEVHAAHTSTGQGPTMEDTNHVLNMRAPPKTHQVVRLIQLVSWNAMDAPPAIKEVHILKHRDARWTVERDNNGKARRATTPTPNDDW